MTDDTIQTAEGTELEVAETPGDARTVVTGATVSGSEKANLGNYENVEPHASLRVEFRPAIDIEADMGAEALQIKLNRLRDTVDEHLTEAIRRARDPEVRE